MRIYDEEHNTLIQLVDAILVAKVEHINDSTSTVEYRSGQMAAFDFVLDRIDQLVVDNGIDVSAQLRLVLDMGTEIHL